MDEPGGTAAERLAGTLELIEMVLMHLPLPDILLAQRVNKAWSDIITGSPQLQRALFFRPSDTIPLRFLHHTGPIMLDCANEAECNYDEKRTGNVAEAYWGSDRDASLKHDNIILNPFMSSHLPWLLKDFDPYVRDLAAAELGNRSQRPEASWRKMLVSQPPVSELGFDTGSAQHWHRVEAQDGEIGITVEGLRTRLAGFTGRTCDVFGLEMAWRSLSPLGASTLTADDVNGEIACNSGRDYLNWLNGFAC
ncbi:hypothetical protein LTR08_005795 [Meristemomyces frigidus]|nr:hypothetical protein LTR08_005795 [Meristemomyces frigidus]